MAQTDPIKDKNQLKKLAEYWRVKGNLRNYLLIVLGVYTALRISDLLRLTWTDVYDERRGEIRSHITVKEKKTGKLRTIALNCQAIKALRLLFPHRRGAFIFVSNRKNALPISRVQAWRIIKAAAVAIGATGRIACHSLRKVIGHFAWKAGVSPVLIMEIYGHSSYEVTRRYLGIAQAEYSVFLVQSERKRSAGLAEKTCASGGKIVQR